MGDSGDGGGLGAAAGPDAAPAEDHSIVVDQPDKSGIVVDQDGNAVLALRPARPDEYGPDDGSEAPDDPESE